MQDLKKGNAAAKFPLARYVAFFRIIPRNRKMELIIKSSKTFSRPLFPFANLGDLFCDLPVFNQSVLAGKGIIVFALLRAKHPPKQNILLPGWVTWKLM